MLGLLKNSESQPHLHRLACLTALLGMVCASCDRAQVKQSISPLTERSVHPRVNQVDETLSVSLQDAFLVQHSQPVLRLSMVYHGGDLHDRYDTTLSFRSSSGESLGSPSYVRFCNCGSPPSFLQNEHAFIWEMLGTVPANTKFVEVTFNSRSDLRVRRVIQFEFPPPSKLPVDDVLRYRRIPPLSERELNALDENQTTANHPHPKNQMQAAARMASVLSWTPLLAIFGSETVVPTNTLFHE